MRSATFNRSLRLLNSQKDSLDWSLVDLGAYQQQQTQLVEQSASIRLSCQKIISTKATILRTCAYQLCDKQVFFTRKYCSRQMPTSKCKASISCEIDTSKVANLKDRRANFLFK